MEVERTSTFERAKCSVARCSGASPKLVVTSKLAKCKKSIGEIVEIANTLNKKYNFFTYNCRHFVLDLLKQII